jgi:hypothetical protein
MFNIQHIFVTGLVLLTASAGQSPDTLWTRTYGGPLNDIAYSACPSFGSGYMIAGLTESGSSGPQDAYLVRINEKGDTLWTRRYGGASYEAFHGIKQTTDGNYIAVGYTSSSGAGNKDIWLAKLNPEGDTIWTRTYGHNLNDCAYTVCETGDQGYIFAGYVDGPSGWIKGDLWIVKTDAYGDTIWTRCYGGSGEDLGITIDTTAGGYIIAGNTMSFGAGGKDAWLLRTNANGDTLWTRTYGLDQEDVGYGVCCTPDGGVIMTGYINGTGAWTPGDLWIIRTDGQGDTIWTRVLGTAGEDDSWSVIPAPAGGYICGARKGVNNGDLWIVRISESGDTLWTMTRGGVSQDAGLGIVVTPDGGFLCAGYTFSTGAGNADFYVVKLESETGIHEGSSNRHQDTVGQTLFVRSLGQVFRPGMCVYDATGSVIFDREPGSGVYFYRVGNVMSRLVIVR